MGAEEQLYRLLEEEAREQRYNKLAYMWPTEGAFCRANYPKHMQLITASGKYHELGMLGGNGAGKSLFGAAFTSILATGRYPDWWDGYVVNGPVTWWVSGVTNDEVRTSTQKYLLGDVATRGDEYLGTGLIPREDIIGWRKAQNGNGLCDFVTVRNRMGPGGVSTIRFKSYKEGREAYQAENLHGAWNDEEVPLDIYGEIVQRFRAETRDGRVLTTCTPLKGKTEFITKMLDWRKSNEEEGASRFTVVIGQREVPHLTEDEINRRLAAANAHERKARETGMPYVGTGLIYPVDEKEYVIRPIRLESHWRRGFGFDYGLIATGFVYCAYDEETDVVYVYKDYKDGGKPIPVHASAMKSLGQWIPGVGDASAKDSDGLQMVAKYNAEGVRMQLAKKGTGSVAIGIDEVLKRLETGRLKVFSTCQHLLEEIRSYSFDEKGNIKKENDHVLDALRYYVNGGGIARSVSERRISGFQQTEASFG